MLFKPSYIVYSNKTYMGALTDEIYFLQIINFQINLSQNFIHEI